MALLLRRIVAGDVDCFCGNSRLFARNVSKEGMVRDRGIGGGTILTPLRLS